MAVSAFFHPIFGSWSFFHRHGELLKPTGRGWESTGYPCALRPLRVLFKPYTSLAASQVPGRKLWEISRGCYQKLVAPRSVQTNFLVHIIYQNRNLVWVMKLWVYDLMFFLPLQSVIAQKWPLIFSSIGCQHCRLVPRSQTYIVFNWYLL